MRTRHEVIEFRSEHSLPVIDLTFTGCRSGPDCYAFDIIDFAQRRIDRWEVPFIRQKEWPNQIKTHMYPGDLPMGYRDAGQYCDDHYMTPHTVQLSPQGRLFATFGVSESGFGIVTIDTVSGLAEFISDPGEVPRLFNATGDFDAAFCNFYFASWPMTNSPRSAQKTSPNVIDIETLDIRTLERKCHYSLAENLIEGRVEGVGLPRSLHQVTLSVDGRYLICAPFDGVELTPESDSPEINGNLRPLKRKFRQRAMLEYVITVDLEASAHWFTKIPVPVPAHIEFDLLNPRVFYASAHNIAGSTIGTVLEGTATLFRLEINNGRTEIVGAYSDSQLFRITQHSVFLHRGRVAVALTCVPNRLVLLDGETMTLWRDVKLFDAPPIDLSGSGALSPESAFTVYSLNPTPDGNFIVLENASNFIIYDVAMDRVLDVKIGRSIPKGYRGRGHTRTAGQ